MFNNPFRQNRKAVGADKNIWKKNQNSTDELSNKEKKWGEVKFNPVKRTIAEPATPWADFKNEILEKERETQNLYKLNIDTEKAKSYLKSREHNYRKLRISEKQNEPTKWESFSDDEAGVIKTKNNLNTPKVNPFNKSKLVSAEQLKKFDSKKLTFAQNNHFRKIITKTTTISRNATLGNAVNELKKRGIKRKFTYNNSN